MIPKSLLIILIASGMRILEANDCNNTPLLDLNALASCIATPNNYCALAQGMYVFGGNVQTLYPANGVTIYGCGSSNYSTTLQRPSRLRGKLIYVAPGSSVTVSHLTINGYRYGFPNVQTGCSTGACGPSGHTGCTALNDSTLVDIWSDGTLVADQLAMWWSGGTAAIYMNGGTVDWSSFYEGRSAGVYNNSNAINVYDGAFQYNGEGGLSLLGAGPSNAWGLTFLQNHFEMPDGVGGGQIWVGDFATNVAIAGNTINGNNWVTPTYPALINPISGTNDIGCYAPSSPQGVVGVELEQHTTSSVYGNEIFGNTSSGVAVHSVDSVYLSGYLSYPTVSNYIHDNTGNSPPFNLPTRGILFQSPLGSSKNVTLSNVLSRNNSYAGGIDFSQDPGVSGTGFTGAANDPYASVGGSHCLPGYSSQTTNLQNRNPYTTNTCP